MTIYPCPMGYCHCSISEQAVGVICLFSVDTSNVNSQCDCQRTGEYLSTLNIRHYFSFSGRCSMWRLQ